MPGFSFTALALVAITFSVTLTGGMIAANLVSHTGHCSFEHCGWYATHNHTTGKLLP